MIPSTRYVNFVSNLAEGAILGGACGALIRGGGITGGGIGGVGVVGLRWGGFSGFSIISSLSLSDVLSGVLTNAFGISAKSSDVV
jgi:hypothetical protein